MTLPGLLIAAWLGRKLLAAIYVCVVMVGFDLLYRLTKDA